MRMQVVINSKKRNDKMDLFVARRNCPWAKYFYINSKGVVCLDTEEELKREIKADELRGIIKDILEAVNAGKAPASPAIPLPWPKSDDKIGDYYVSFDGHDVSITDYYGELPIQEVKLEDLSFTQCERLVFRYMYVLTR